jgi:hypothetical protein
VDAVALGEPEHDFRLDRPLDVQMQLGLRQPFDETRHDHLRCGFSVLLRSTRDDSGAAPPGII